MKSKSENQHMQFVLRLLIKRSVNVDSAVCGD